MKEFDAPEIEVVYFETTDDVIAGSCAWEDHSCMYNDQQ